MVSAVMHRKSLRRRLAGLLAMAILFVQLATAAYACPAVRGVADAGAAAMAGMPCAGMVAAGVALDAEQPGLCLQHCQFGGAAQPADQVQPIVVAVMALPPMFWLPLDERRESALVSGAEADRLRDRPPPLAHSIAHCCYRI